MRESGNGGRLASVVGVRRNGTRPAAGGPVKTADAEREMPAPEHPERSARWEWMRHWEFWLALAIGAGLRLWRLDVAQFTFGPDQTSYMTMAREALVQGLLPVTGLRFTIGVMSPPLDIYLAMLFSLFGKNPMPVVWSIALWNVLGLALCYIFTLRYFGRRAAFVATLLLGTCGAAVVFSRFLWQLNYVPTLLVLWGMTLFQGAVRGGRGWLVPNVALLAAVIFLHPTAALLAPLIVLAILIGPDKPRLREYALTAGVLALMLVPTILWEIVSNHSDLHQLRTYSSQPGVFNLDVFSVLYQVLGPPTLPGVGPWSPFARVTPDSPYAALGKLNKAITASAMLLYAGSYLLVTLLGAQAVWRAWAASASSAKHTLSERAGGLWRELLRQPVWRAQVMLWVWLTLPTVAMLRHSSKLYVHYLLILYPAAFMLAGIAVAWVLDWCRDLPRWIALLLASRREPGGQWLVRAGKAVVIVAVGGLVLGQAAQCALYVASLARGAFYADAGYGYTLGEVQTVDAQLSALQRKQGARSIWISTPVSYYYQSLRYLLVDEEPGRTSFYGDCLVLPPPGAAPALIVSTQQESHAAALLSTLPNAQHVEDLALPGGEPFSVYRLAGGLPSLTGETALAPMTFRDPQGNGLRLQAVSAADPGVLRLRWTVLGSTAPGQPAPAYHIQVGDSGGTATASSAAAQGDCAPTGWQAGATVFTWVASTAPSFTWTPSTPIQVTSTEQYLWAPTLGPLRMLSGFIVNTPPVTLQTAGG